MISSGSSSRSEISTTIPRLVSVSASWCSGFETLVSFPSRQAVERHEQRAQVARPRARRQHADDPIVEGHQADRVALAVHQVAERGREARAVLELRHAARAVPHRAAHVEHQVAIEVGLLFELLDVVAIAARVDLPVDRRQIVAGDVLAVFGELDAEAFERAAVQAERKPSTIVRAFNSSVPRRATTAGSRNCRSRAVATAYIPLLGTGTVSISRSTIASELMRSDSA